MRAVRFRFGRKSWKLFVALDNTGEAFLGHSAENWMPYDDFQTNTVTYNVGFQSFDAAADDCILFTTRTDMLLNLIVLLSPLDALSNGASDPSPQQLSNRPRPPRHRTLVGKGGEES